MKVLEVVLRSCTKCFWGVYTTILDKISCKKSENPLSLNVAFSLYKKVMKCTFLGCQDQSLWQTDVPPPPKPSMLGVVK